MPLPPTSPPPPPVLRQKRPVPAVQARNPGGVVPSLRCYPEVRKRVTEGEPIAEIVAFIQQECGEATDSSVDALTRALYRFKESIPPGEMLAGALPPKHAQAMAKVREGLDELAEMDALITLQRERITELRATEKEMGGKILFPTLTNEIRLQKEMLMGKAQMRQMLGLVDSKDSVTTTTRVEETVIRSMEQNIDPAVGRVMRDPEATHRVLMTMKAIRRASTVTVISGDEPSSESDE